MTHIIGAPTLDDALAALSRRVVQTEARREKTLVFCEDSLTLLAERAVLKESGATFLTEVTTFARFLSDERRVLSKQGSVAAVSAILSECEGSLACFSANAAEAVYETVAQLAASRVGSRELREGAQKSEGMLRSKLLDLALILDKYTEFLHEKALLDENGYLALLPEKLSSGALDGVNVIFFGFTSFTKQGAEGIRAAVKYAKSVTGIFPAGKAEYYTNESARTFRAACEEDPPTVSMAESSLKGEAETLRRGIFSPEAFLYPPVQAEQVHLFTAQDESEEARTVCSLIKRYTDGGMRLRDIAVLVPASSFSVFEKYFSAYHIPYFADVKRPFSRHPFCAFVISVLRAVSDGGLPASVDAVCANVCFGEGSVYRNYLAKFGGWRGAYKREIREDARDFTQDVFLLQSCRTRLISMLGALPRKGTGRTFTDGIRTLLRLTDAEKVAEELAAHFAGAERNFLSLADLEDTLGEIETVAGERVFTAREFSSLFSGCTDAMKRAMIPVLSDAVFLGDATQSRFARARVLFVTGATDALPASGEDTALISDTEIGKLGAQGVDIEPALAVVNARAREALALNTCSFSEALYVSRPLRLKGEEATAGELYSSCASMFLSAPMPECFPYTCSERVPALLELLRERTDFEEGKTHDERMFSSVWAALSERGEENTLRALTEGGEKQPVPEAADLLFAGDVSPTLLESYFSCPYAGFMKNVLRLKEREEASQIARDAGDFVHAVLSALAPRFNEIENEQACRDAAQEEGRKLLASARYGALSDSDAGKYASGRLLSESTAVALAAFRSIRQSSFRVRESKTGEIEVRLPELHLYGKADRVDDAGEYVRVIDYKTGKFDPAPAAYYTGRSLQLELYLLAASQGGKPAGAFYFPAEDKFTSPEDAKFRMQGFYCRDEDVMALLDREGGGKSTLFDSSAARGMGEKEFSDFLGYARLISLRAQQELREGNIAPSPYDGSCEFCAFCGACGFVGLARKEAGVKCADIAKITAGGKSE